MPQWLRNWCKLLVHDLAWRSGGGIHNPSHPFLARLRHMPFTTLQVPSKWFKMGKRWKTMVNVLNLSDKNTHKKTVLDLSYKHTIFFLKRYLELCPVLWRGLRRRIPCGHVLRGCCSAPRRMCFLIKASDVFNFYKLYFHMTFFKGRCYIKLCFGKEHLKKNFQWSTAGVHQVPSDRGLQGFLWLQMIHTADTT